MTATLPTAAHRSRVRELAGHWPWLLLASIALVAVIWPIAAGEQSADFARALLPPGNGTLLGTDHSGYDIGVRTAEGLRISLVIALACAVISTVIGLTVGKLLTVDLREVDALWRAGLFLVVGLGLLRLGFLLPSWTDDDEARQ